MLQLFSLTLLFFFSQLITEPDTQTDGSKTAKKAERKLSDCVLSAPRQLASFILLSCRHLCVIVQGNTCRPVFLVWCVCRHVVHFTPPFHSAFSSCVTSFFFALYFSPRPCVRLLLHECSRGCPFMLRSSEGPKKRRILCNAEIWVSSYFAGIIFLGSHDNNSSWVKEACYTWENSLFVVTAL